jgi:hypothetical protein
MPSWFIGRSKSCSFDHATQAGSGAPASLAVMLARRDPCFNAMFRAVRHGALHEEETEGMEQEDHGNLAEAHCRRGLRKPQDRGTNNACCIDQQELVQVASSTIFHFPETG